MNICHLYSYNSHVLLLSIFVTVLYDTILTPFLQMRKLRHDRELAKPSYVVSDVVRICTHAQTPDRSLLTLWHGKVTADSDLTTVGHSQGRLITQNCCC